LPEADTAQLKLPYKPAWPSAALAAAVISDGVFLFLGFFRYG